MKTQRKPPLINHSKNSLWIRWNTFAIRCLKNLKDLDINRIRFLNDGNRCWVMNLPSLVSKELFIAKVLHYKRNFPSGQTQLRKLLYNQTGSISKYKLHSRSLRLIFKLVLFAIRFCFCWYSYQEVYSELYKLIIDL